MAHGATDGVACVEVQREIGTRVAAIIPAINFGLVCAESGRPLRRLVAPARLTQTRDLFPGARRGERKVKPLERDRFVPNSAGGSCYRRALLRDDYE